MKFYDVVESLLKQDQRFVAENGSVLKNAVYEAAMNLDPNLIRLLLSNDETKPQFFKDIDGVMVFDKVGFGWVVNNRQFLPDSYTRFKNKIGLADENEAMISTSGRVELIFPFKDCILEGGQNFEDQRRNEVFYNTSLAPDEIDRILYKKVLVNAKKYTSEYEESVSEISDEDNILIKGNNLLVLSSLTSRYANQVKFIFADPPYYFSKNKAEDAFKYNSNFHLSSWLVFCKNRFEQAKRLLSNDGILAVTIGVDGYCHLKVLLDEIFDVNSNYRNYIGTITWRKTDNQSNIGDFSNVIDYILLYRKNGNAKLYNLPLTEKAIKEYSYEDENGKYRRANLLDQTRGRFFYEIKTPDGSALNGPWMVEQDEMSRLMKGNGIHWPEKGMQIPYGKTYLKDSLEKGQISSDMWDGSYGTNQRGADEIKELFGERAFPFAKPERLMMNLITIATKPGDLVLDFCLGSGTTCAVAHKMGRRYIGIDQMDYIETLAVERLRKVIAGEQGGVSSEVNWNGGGSFIYCELAKSNMLFVDEIQAAASTEKLKEIYERMVSTGFISCKINPKMIDENAEEFVNLSIENQKRLLMDMLDMNLLYVNYCDLEDEEFAISNIDKSFSKSFYREV